MNKNKALLEFFAFMQQYIRKFKKGKVTIISIFAKGVKIVDGPIS